jgi:hypothetical protein
MWDLIPSIVLLSPIAHISSHALPKPDGFATLGARALLNSSAYTIPQNSDNSTGRAADILIKQAGFTYGPPVAGGPYFPTGVLGLAKVAVDNAEQQLDLVPETAGTALDTTAATVGILKVCESEVLILWQVS